MILLCFKEKQPCVDSWKNLLVSKQLVQVNLERWMYVCCIALYLCKSLCIYAFMHACVWMHTYIVKRTSVRPTLGANGNKKDCKKLEQRNFQKLQKLQLQKKRMWVSVFFLTKDKKKTHNLLQVFFVKKPRPRSWKLCIEGGPCELMRLQKQKAWEATSTKKKTWWIILVW